MTITHINPDTMHTNPAFSQAVLVEGGRLLFIGGQNGVDAQGAIVAGGVKEQTIAAYDQVKRLLAAVGADQRNVVKLTIVLRTDADLMEGFAGADEGWGDYPTAITVMRVDALARPDALVEIEAVAAV